MIPIWEKREKTLKARKKAFGATEAGEAGVAAAGEATVAGVDGLAAGAGDGHPGDGVTLTTTVTRCTAAAIGGKQYL